MTRHMKRLRMPKMWPLARKGMKYIAKPRGLGIPISVVLRDMLKLAKNRKEVKKTIHEKQILLNQRNISNENNAIALFDVISVIPSKKHYKLGINENGKYEMEEIKESESERKISKIIGKRLMKKEKMQINFEDGRNILVKKDFKGKVNDSVLRNFKEKKIEKIIEMDRGGEILVLHGRHSGARAKIDKIIKEESMIEANTENKKTISVPIKFVMVIK
jgi:small subunit ribosomal protein S4e